MDIKKNKNTQTTLLYNVSKISNNVDLQSNFHPTHIKLCFTLQFKDKSKSNQYLIPRVDVSIHFLSTSNLERKNKVNPMAVTSAVGPWIMGTISCEVVFWAKVVILGTVLFGSDMGKSKTTAEKCCIKHIFSNSYSLQIWFCLCIFIFIKLFICGQCWA